MTVSFCRCSSQGSIGREELGLLLDALGEVSFIIIISLIYPSFPDPICFILFIMWSHMSYIDCLQNLTDVEVDNMVAAVDKDGSGEIEFGDVLILNVER